MNVKCLTKIEQTGPYRHKVCMLSTQYICANDFHSKNMMRYLCFINIAISRGLYGFWTARSPQRVDIVKSKRLTAFSQGLSTFYSKLCN